MKPTCEGFFMSLDNNYKLVDVTSDKSIINTWKELSSHR